MNYSESIDLIQWDDIYSVGMEDLDSQHRSILKIINQLIIEKKTGHLDHKISSIMEELVNYAQYHFSSEEKFMKQYGYSQLGVHKVEHQFFIKKLEDFQKELGKKEEDIHNDILSFLQGWWSHHVLVVDQQYAKYTRDSIKKD